MVSVSSYVFHPTNVNAQNNETINIQNQSLSDKITIVKVLAHNLAQSLNDSAGYLKVTSTIPEVANAKYADKINSSLHGIPKEVDITKRNIARVF